MDVAWVCNWMSMAFQKMESCQWRRFVSETNVQGCVDEHGWLKAGQVRTEVSCAHSCYDNDDDGNDDEDDDRVIGIE